MQLRSHRPLVAALHWTTVALVLTGLTAVLVRELVESRTARGLLIEVHRWCGLLILALTVWRLQQRSRFALPDLLPQRSKHVRRLASIVHFLLYALLIAVPIAGWSLISADDEDLSERLRTWHIAFACAFVFLAVAHVAAACWHQFIRREPILRAMWPWRSLVKKEGDSR